MFDWKWMIPSCRSGLPALHAHPKVDALSRMLLASLSGIFGQRTSDLVTEDGCRARRRLIPAFRPEELALLSQQIAEAFALARPDERVTFYLSQPQTSVKRVITTGGLYLHGTELHFILGNWQIIYGIPTYGMIYDRRYPMRPTAAKGFDLFFDPGEATIAQQHSLWDTLLANTQDELVIDLTKTVPAPIASLATP